MKQLLTLVMALWTMGSASSQSLEFTISGRIKGLEKGDTLRFKSVSLPEWKSEPAFDIIVQNKDTFTYKGSHPHTQYYSMECLPVGKALLKSDKNGISLLISDGDFQINGTRDDIYYSTLTGGFYDDKWRAATILSDSLGLERSRILQLRLQKSAERDTTAVRKLSAQFNSFQSANAGHFKRAKTLKQEYLTSVSNEYVALELCQQSWQPLEMLETGFQRLDSTTQKSYYGAILNSIIEKAKSLMPGEVAPDFTLTTLKGEKISLKEFSGKYVMVYHFGMCPGSMQADPQVRDLYNKHSDKLEIIGFTDSMDELRKVCGEIEPGTTVMGMDFKKIMTDMTSHPWRHEACTDIGDNGALKKLYNIQGLPFFIVISPEGKMVSRGFFEAFNEAEKVITGQ